MPDATEEVLGAIEKNLILVSSPSQLASEGVTAAGMIRLLLAGVGDDTVYDPEPVSFSCTCSRQRVTAMINSLGEAELAAMLQDGQAEVRCNFCNEFYRFDAAELKQIEAGKKQAES